MQGNGIQKKAKLALAMLVLLAMAGCGTSNTGGYYKNDGPGDDIPTGLMHTPDAQPKDEPLASGPNRPYSVFGKRYVPFRDNRSYKQQGMASWYGKKFHGNKTSSGERYDMYKMTAAHKTLPIPSYARVTNLDNGRQVIVRINDRGPFHAGRIIDLSYTAALKLGYIGKGSTRVEVERVFPGENLSTAQKDVSPAQRSDARSAELSGYYVQLGAFSQSQNAESMRMRYALEGVDNIAVVRKDNLYRLMAGPFDSRAKAVDVAGKLPYAGSKPIIVQH